jgi:hypothetical protein
MGRARLCEARGIQTLGLLTMALLTMALLTTALLTMALLTAALLTMTLPTRALLTMALHQGTTYDGATCIEPFLQPTSTSRRDRQWRRHVTPLDNGMKDRKLVESAELDWGGAPLPPTAAAAREPADGLLRCGRITADVLSGQE